MTGRNSAGGIGESTKVMMGRPQIKNQSLCRLRISPSTQRHNTYRLADALDEPIVGTALVISFGYRNCSDGYEPPRPPNVCRRRKEVSREAGEVASEAA